MMSVCHSESAYIWRRKQTGSDVACGSVYEAGNVLAAEQPFQEILALLLEI